MEDKQLQKNEFIREKIKTKPLNKKRIVAKLAVSALSGLVFAIAACIVFAIVLPRLPRNFGEPQPESDREVQEPEDTEQDTQEAVVSQPVPDVEVPQSLTIGDYQEIQNQLYAIGSQANKSIVVVASVVNDTDLFLNSYESEGHESGVIIAENSSELLILTERKVIADASRISVTFIDDSVAEATLKKYDGNTGIAILSVAKSNLEDTTLSAIEVAELGNSNTVSKGTIVIALGSPLGTSYSILTGSITSTSNEITTEDHNYTVFTTDIVASKNGSGILISAQGEVIGIVMQDYSASQAENTLTAVAVSKLEPAIDLLLNGQDIPYLGLRISTVTDKIADKNDIPKGVYIHEVTMDSPAMKAGLQSGDVIISINGENVSTANAYSNKVLALTPGESVPIVVKRQGADGYSEFTFQVEAGVLK